MNAMRSQVLFVGESSSWVPPDGLDRCRPREVRLTTAGKGVAALAALLLAGGLAAGVVLGAVAMRQAEESRLLRQEGAVTDGAVTRLWRAGDDNRQRWMSYRFTFEGHSYGRNIKVSARTWGNLRTGASIPVHYVPSRPGLNYPFNVADAPMPPWVPFAVALALASCSLVVVLHIRRQIRLLAEGRAAPGLVTKHSKVQHGSHGSDLGQKFYYEFPLLSGAIARGRAGPAKKPPAIGATIPVLYDPESPRRNVPYPLSLVTPANRRSLRCG